MQERDADPLDRLAPLGCLQGFVPWVAAVGGCSSASQQELPGKGRAAADEAPQLGCAPPASSQEGVCCALVLTKPMTRVKLR